MTLPANVRQHLVEVGEQCAILVAAQRSKWAKKFGANLLTLPTFAPILSAYEASDTFDTILILIFIIISIISRGKQLQQTFVFCP